VWGDDQADESDQPSDGYVGTGEQRCGAGAEAPHPAGTLAEAPGDVVAERDGGDLLGEGQGEHQVGDQVGCDLDVTLGSQQAALPGSANRARGNPQDEGQPPATSEQGIRWRCAPQNGLQYDLQRAPDFTY